MTPKVNQYLREGRRRVSACGRATLLLLLLAQAASGQTTERIGSPDPFRIAVRLTQAAEKAGVEPAVVLSRHSLVATETLALGSVRFEMVSLAKALNAAGKVEDVLAALAAEPEIEYATQVYETPDGLYYFPTDAILIRFEDAVAPNVARNVLGTVPRVGILRERFGGWPNGFRLSTRSNTGPEVLNDVRRLAALPGVRWVESDILSEDRPSVTPDDPLFNQCWGLLNTGFSYASFNSCCNGACTTTCSNPAITGIAGMDMNAERAWDIETGDSDVIVVVLDEGVQQTHPDINQRSGRDFTTDGTTNGGPLNNCDPHGTAVAGCVSAIMNNATGTVGIAPDCRVASARVASPNATCGHSSLASWYVDALEWALDIDARVTNTSRGRASSDAISDMFGYSALFGIVHFASSGNSCASSAGFPASVASVAAVGAINADGTAACFSNADSDLFCAAPGVNVQTTDMTGTQGYNTSSTASGGDYTQSNGTSFASPYAAGVAALIVSEDNLGPVYVFDIIATTARDLGSSGWDTQFGYGLPDAWSALQCAGDVYVEAGIPSGGSGAYGSPLNSVADGVADTPTSGHLVLRAGTYAETVVFRDPMLVTACGGTAVVTTP